MKNIDWKNVGWRSLQALIVALFNIPLYVFIAGVFQDTRITIDGSEYDKVVSWFNQEWYQAPIICLFIGLGVLISIVFIKFLYKENRQDKRIKEQTKELKDEQREEKDINKYL